MAASLSFTGRLARFFRRCLTRLDTRILVGLVSLSGVLAWVLSWQATLCFFILAAAIAFTAAVELRDGRAALTAYILFVLLWTASQLVLYLFERPGEFGPATAQSLLLGGKLFTLLGLAMAVPLAATPLMLGRTLTWYLGWLVGMEAWVCRTVLRGKAAPVLAGGVWRAALALCLMMAFFPRSLRAMRELRRSMLMRAPSLPLRKKVVLMGLALLRVVSAQTWDMTLAIASRDLYRPEPWEWQGHRKV